MEQRRRKMVELNVRTLSVSGMGELRVMPDIATVRLSVITRAERAADAVRQNAQLSAQVSTRVTALAGVDDQDVRTTGIRVSPVVRFDRLRHRGRCRTGPGRRYAKRTE
jgi:uncharacterized protein